MPTRRSIRDAAAAAFARSRFDQRMAAGLFALLALLPLLSPCSAAATCC